MKLALLSAGALALITAASAAAAVLPGFHSPSGNIRCYYNPHGLTSRGFTPALRCGLEHASYSAQLQHRCAAGDWHGFTLTPTGRPLLFCPGGASGDRVASATLRYRTTWRRGPFTCTSRVTGVTCRSRSGHGLFLSREAYRTW